MRSPYLRGASDRPYVVGHRGALARAPENTIASFAKAVELGVDAFEFDVQRTADGVPVVLHDETLDRTTSGRGYLRETAWSAVRPLGVPSLDDVLAWARPRSAGLVLNIKQPAPARGRPRDDGLVASVVDALRRADLVDRTLLISFDHPSLAEAIRLEPRARTALLTDGPTLVDPLAPARAVAGVMGLHVRWMWISPALVASAHGAGLHVHAWGLGHPMDGDAVRRLVGMGVDSLSADDPGELLALLAGR